jgi:osmotically-inducible protein OsmY
MVLVAATLAAGEARAQAKPASLDASITSGVQRALAKDPFLRQMDISVQTHGAVVNLTGFVRSLQDIAKAGDLARAVYGVTHVRNGLRVADRPSRA